MRPPAVAAAERAERRVDYRLRHVLTGHVAEPTEQVTQTAEEVAQWEAAVSQALAVGPLERGDQEDDLHALLKIRRPHRVHAAQIEEEEPLREGEIFL